MDIKAKEWGRSNRKKKVGIGPSLISATKDVAGGSNGYSGKFGDEETKEMIIVIVVIMIF